MYKSLALVISNSYALLAGSIAYAQDDKPTIAFPAVSGQWY